MSTGDTVFLIIMIFLLLLCFILMFFAIKAQHNINKARRAQKKVDRQNNVRTSGYFSHFNGLPLANGVMVRCSWCNDKIVFESNGATYNLPLENLMNVCIKTDVEIQREYVSSTKKTLAGAVLFGPIGAIIASKPKVKETRNATPYLIFTYKSKDGQTIKYVALQGNQYNAAVANKMIKYFYQLPPKENVSIDL